MLHECLATVLFVYHQQTASLPRQHLGQCTLNTRHTNVLGAMSLHRTIPLRKKCYQIELPESGSIYSLEFVHEVPDELEICLPALNYY